MGLVDDVLDFLSFLILLGICIAVAFGVVLPTFYEQEDITSSVLTDKTAPTLKGYESLNIYDGSMSRLEVALMTQVQDSGLPEPKHYKMMLKDNSNNLVELEVDKDDILKYSITYGGTEDYNNLTNYILNETSNLKLYYNYGATDNSDDDFYEIK